MKQRTSKRDTVVVVCATAKKMGATILGVRQNLKHPRVHIRTRQGVEFWMSVSQGKVEPYKQIGWTKQAIRRANRKANDNGFEPNY